MQSSVARSSLHIYTDKENPAAAKRANAPAARVALGDLSNKADASSRTAKRTQAAPAAETFVRPKRTRTKVKGIPVDANAAPEYAPSSQLQEPYRLPADLDFPLEDILRPRPKISIFDDHLEKPEYSEDRESEDLPPTDLASLIPAEAEVNVLED